MTRFACLALGLSLLALPPAACAQAGDRPSLSEEHVRPRLDATFDRLVEAGFTGYVMISHQGQTVYARGEDSADMHFGPDSQIDILSMSKSLTGMVLARLIEDGELFPGTTLAEIFADVPAEKAGITLHQMLTHTAGLPHALGEDTEYLDRDAYLARAWSTPLLSEPGTRYEYSNVGYSILAAVVEVATGEAFDTYLGRHFLEPAGLTHTGYESQCCATSGGQAVTEVSWGGDRASWHLIGNGGMLSTPSDMLAWIRAYETGALTGQAATERAHQPYEQEGENAPSHYGYGLVVEDLPQLGRVYWHNGGSRAFNGHWRYYADHDVAIFVTSDQWEVDPDSVERALARALLAPSQRK
ncbi:serine hydrolase domain-containing protein [Maricaulis parjimensis]|uniref:serine hydrolase domain-containing protein n=1 Tax=Maricaulis parjimensis TaxID=144023 RepID=UPI001939C989|nr:serine hydrolase domain-containing protein [Maricaulis parjimensis]